MKTTRRILFIAALSAGLLKPAHIAAQKGPAWEGLLREVMTVEDGEAPYWEETLELLTELAEHPMDINSATREQLEMLCFLSAQQIEDILEYLYQYGPMKSAGELRMIASLDYTQIQLLPYFTFFGEPPEQGFPSWSAVSRYGRHELTTYGRVPLYERRGDKDGYMGYPYKHWTQYNFHYNDYVKAGIVGAQDAGEPFLSKRNGAGYDFYSYYVQLRHWGRVETAVVGKYKLALGMGLVANNSFGLGKLATLQNLGRSTYTIRAHSSRSAADHFQGAAATLRLGKGLTATAFASYRPLDATLNDNGEAQTLLTDGYHRTPTEMRKKNNTHATAAGANLNFRYQRFHLGASAVYTHLDRRLQPNLSALYRRYYAQGNDFLNLSMDYGYASRRINLNGETAMDRNGALATLNTVSLQLADGLGLMALQRFYSYRYTSLYARSFSEGSRVQNESGIYVGLTWQPGPDWRLQAYTDFAYFPWPRYQVSQESHNSDHLLQLTYKPRRWQFQGRYRLHLRQRDLSGAEVKTLYTRQEQRVRLTASYAPAPSLNLTVQADGSQIHGGGEAEYGWSTTAQADYEHKWLKMNAGVSYFDTDSYDSRLYVYERGLLYTFNFPMLYGQGVRYMLTARVQLGESLMLAAKLGVTDYLDRTVTGTGLQQVNSSALADIDVQLRWKF